MIVVTGSVTAREGSLEAVRKLAAASPTIEIYDATRLESL
jgi:hypothetical protein